jgi:hypothetical protein
MDEQLNNIDLACGTIDDVILLMVTLNDYLVTSQDAKEPYQEHIFTNSADQYRALCGMLIGQLKSAALDLEKATNNLDEIHKAAATLLCTEVSGVRA